MNLARELARRVRGEVRADPTALAAHSTDASNYRHVPLAVVTPRDAEDVVAAVSACRDLGVPVLPRGAGTSLAGQACNVAVILDFTRHLSRVLHVDPDARLARVEPGCVLDVLQLAARPHGLRFGPDPSSHDRCTLGGMIANDACGARSLVHGRTSANVAALDVVLQDGERLRAERLGEERFASWRAEPSRRGELARDLARVRDASADLVRARFRPLRRRVSGFALDALLPESGVDLARALCGTEGTCAVTLEATVRLVESPPATCLLVAGFPDIMAAAEAVPAALTHEPCALEAVEATLLRTLPASSRATFPEGGAWLFIELAGPSAAEALARAESLARALRAPSRVIADPRHARMFWKLREAGVGATARLVSGVASHPGWEDAAVPPERLASYVRGFGELLRRFRLDAALYGHFGEGCVHARIGFELRSAEGVAAFRAFLDEAADLVVAHDGTLSGEHGDGQARGALLERMYGADLVRAFLGFRRAWDPSGLLNPGKVVPSRAPDEDLRPQALAPAPPGDALHEAALGCVGVGACRRDEGGVMCPSFRATRAEEHSPRGRARLLAELLAGAPGVETLSEDDVALALEACLGCKACGSECPAGVDVAAMKAELLERRHRLVARPRSHRLARIDVALRLASRAPCLVNALAALPPSRTLLRLLADVAEDAPLPRLAEETFHAAHERLARRPTPGTPVTLHVDTFTNHLDPQVGHAAMSVMERAGFSVRAPRLPCCGRPLAEVGRLDDARARLRDLLDALGDAETPLVGLEPACVSMLRDEAPRLLPRDPRALRLAGRARFFTEWVVENAARLPRLDADPCDVLLQPHCHESALGDPDTLPAVLAALGARVTRPDGGCCGMAGTFGFVTATRDLALAVASLSLVPAFLRAAPGALFVADGFSCRTQARAATALPVLHLAELLALRGRPPA